MGTLYSHRLPFCVSPRSTKSVDQGLDFVEKAVQLPRIILCPMPAPRPSVPLNKTLCKLYGIACFAFWPQSAFSAWGTLYCSSHLLGAAFLLFRHQHLPERSFPPIAALSPPSYHRVLLGCVVFLAPCCTRSTCLFVIACCPPPDRSKSVGGGACLVHPVPPVSTTVPDLQWFAQ